MVAESNVAEEKDVPRIVEAWVARNPAEFGEGDNLLYRKNVFDRCKKYLGAPDEFLKTMLETFPENIKWYFNVFQTVFIAGLFGLGVSLTILAINQLSAWKWLLSIIILLILIIPTLIINRGTETPLLSHLIQRHFRITHNLRELQIEMYFVSKILEIREAKKNKENTKES